MKMKSNSGEWWKYVRTRKYENEIHYENEEIEEQKTSEKKTL